jgi:SOS response regulatory protein OraA/RecX
MTKRMKGIVVESKKRTQRSPRVLMRCLKASDADEARIKAALEAAEEVLIGVQIAKELIKEFILSCC